MIRRSPTRIELKLEDIQEFDYPQKSERKAKGASSSNEESKKQRQERIGYSSTGNTPRNAPHSSNNANPIGAPRTRIPVPIGIQPPNLLGLFPTDDSTTPTPRRRGGDDDDVEEVEEGDNLNETVRLESSLEEDLPPIDDLNNTPPSSTPMQIETSNLSTSSDIVLPPTPTPMDQTNSD